MVDLGAAREIEVAINGALSRKGVGGTVVVRGNTAELHGAGPVVAIDLGEWVEQWNLLPPDMRDRRAEVAAERLRGSVQDVSGKKEGSGFPLGPLLVKALGALLLVGVLGGGAYWLYQSNFFGPKGETAPLDGDKPITTRAPVIDPAQRAKKVCEAARSRVYSGASIAMDVEGWIVELWLARAPSKGPLHTDAKLLERTQTKELSTEFGVKSTGTVEVVDATKKKLGAVAATIRFNEGFVEPFLGTKGRQRYIELLISLAETTDADYAALYARCAHLKVRDIGAYYRGRDAAGAAAALLYAQGGFSEPKAVTLGGLDGEWLKALQAATTPVDDKSLLELTRKVGARLVTVSEDAGTPSVALRFVLGGPTRAQSAARMLAKQLNLR